MHRSVHKGFIAAITCAAPMPYMATALAQDVRSLCADTVNDDRLRPIAAALVQQARGLFGFSTDTPSAFIKKSTSFRCMNGKVWLCNYGANLVCGKANASRTSAGAADFCRQNPSADVVPMAATGHDTIYQWKCVGNEASISKQVETVDPRGFITENWKELE
jgi:hypothetical protein